MESFKLGFIVKCLALCTSSFFYLLSTDVYATCHKKGTWAAHDSYSAKINLGNITVMNDTVQPPGTILGTTIVDWYTARNLSPETVMYECALTDLPNMFENYSTNGDEAFGGYDDIGRFDGLVGVYASIMRHVGIRITNMTTGKYLSRYWQQDPIGDRYEVSPTDPNKILFKAKHLSRFKVDAIKVSHVINQKSDLIGGGRHTYCGTWSQTPSAADISKGITTYAYPCNQPSGYFAFAGPGIASDTPGADHDTSYKFFSANGIGVNMKDSNTMVTYAPGCVFKNVTPVVVFSTITPAQLNEGESREASFHIDIDCMAGTSYGFGTGQISIGLQANANSVSRGRILRLVNSNGGMSYLVSEDYTNTRVAKGVGVKLQDTMGNDLLFLTSENTGGGSLQGWMDIRQSADIVGTVGSSSTYRKNLVAVFEKIPTQAVTLGKYTANAYVIVRIQ